jgi:hypothetical protein
MSALEVRTGSLSPFAPKIHSKKLAPYQSFTTFFFKNSPKLACQAQKPFNSNKKQEIRVAF